MTRLQDLQEITREGYEKLQRRFPVRSALLDASRPVLRRLMHDCQPTLVIVAGMDGFRAFEEALGRVLQVQRALSRGGSGGVYQWAANRRPATSAR